MRFPTATVTSAALALSLGLTIATATPGHAAPLFSDEAFTFVALGDMPYGQAAQAGYERLIARVNALDPVFTIHVGDTKGGGAECSDDRLEFEYENFMRYEGAVV